MANKIVQLVDKNSNNLYPVAGSVIDDAVSTGAISSQAVTTAKIANGAVTGVANDATAIGTAKLALDTVGTPNLRDQSVTSDKIDWATMSIQSKVLAYIDTTTITGAAGSGWTERVVGESATFDCEVGGRYLVCGTQNYWSSQNANALVTNLGVFDSGNNKIKYVAFRTPPSVTAGATYNFIFTATTNKMTIKRFMSVYQGVTYKFGATALEVFLVRVG